MVVRKHTAPKARRLSRHDLSRVLGHFADARSVIECACVVLEGNPNSGDEAACLRTGLGMLQSAYNELDIEISNLQDGDA